jgi:hypothetical protein
MMSFRRTKLLTDPVHVGHRAHYLYEIHHAIRPYCGSLQIHSNADLV